MWAENLLAPRSSWGDVGTINQNWGVQPGGPYINVAIAWGTTAPSCPAFTAWIPESLRDDVYDARWCALVRVGARWCALMCVGARWCALVRVGVHWCVLVRVGVR